MAGDTYLIVTVARCRTWQVVGFSYGRCGLCGEIPTTTAPLTTELVERRPRTATAKIVRRAGKLDLAAEFDADGRPYVTADADGTVEHHNGSMP